MSRYDELCDALRGVRQQYGDYREECFLFVGAFLQGFRRYLGAPEGFVNLYAKFGPLAGRKLDGPAAALHLHDDGWWHFGIALDLCEEPNVMPYECVGFDMRLKKTGELFLLEVKVKDLPSAFEFPAGERGQFTAVYEHLFKHLMERYESSFRDFLEQGDPTKRFGF